MLNTPTLDERTESPDRADLWGVLGLSLPRVRRERRLWTSLRTDSATGPVARSACSISIESSESSAVLALSRRPVASESDARSLAARCCSNARDSSDVAKTWRVSSSSLREAVPDGRSGAAFDSSWLLVGAVARGLPRSVSPSLWPISSMPSEPPGRWQQQTSKVHALETQASSSQWRESVSGCVSSRHELCDLPSALGGLYAPMGD